MNHIVLAGDSIFDNFAYVQQRQSVIEQLAKSSGDNFKATLLAVDGSVTNDLQDQFGALPVDTTHLFISSGGNDALGSAHLLRADVSTVYEALSLFSVVIERFKINYRSMLQKAVARVDNVAVCTIYDSIPGYEKEPLIALKLFNEVILREAFSLGLPVIDLRLLCDQPSDYSTISTIEPSEQGGVKIANMIIKLLGEHGFSETRSVIWTEV